MRTIFNNTDEHTATALITRMKAIFEKDVQKLILFNAFIDSQPKDMREGIRFLLTGYPDPYDNKNEREYIESRVYFRLTYDDDVQALLVGKPLSYYGLRYYHFLRNMDIYGTLRTMAERAAQLKRTLWDFEESHHVYSFPFSGTALVKEMDYTITLYMERLFMDGVNVDNPDDTDLITYTKNYYGSHFGYKDTPQSVIDYCVWYDDFVAVYFGPMDKLFRSHIKDGEGSAFENFDEVALALDKIVEAQDLNEVIRFADEAYTLIGNHAPCNTVSPLQDEHQALNPCIIMKELDQFYQAERGKKPAMPRTYPKDEYTALAAIKSYQQDIAHYGYAGKEAAL